MKCNNQYLFYSDLLTKLI